MTTKKPIDGCPQPDSPGISLSAIVQPKIQRALVNITRAIAEQGIGKTRDNAQQHYKFRGIDEVMQAFSPLFAKEGVIVIPSFIDRQEIERQTRSGGALYSVTLQGSFTFQADDGSRITVGPFYGEAMDSGDKATNKAMAVAFKYALFQTFCVPLEGVTGGDADAVTQEETVSKEAGVVSDWLDVIARADTREALAEVGSALAKEKVSASAKAKLRAAFTAQRTKVTEATA